MNIIKFMVLGNYALTLDLKFGNMRIDMLT